jgi:hypothetical protein
VFVVMLLDVRCAENEHSVNQIRSPLMRDDPPVKLVLV